MNVHGWPFGVEVFGDLQCGGGARLELAAPSPFDPEAIDIAVHCVEAFVALGDAGALGGAYIDPMQSTVTLSKGPDVQGPLLSWEIWRMVVDPLAVAVMLHMLAQMLPELSGVSLTAHGADGTIAPDPGRFPSFWQNLPFALDDTRDGRNVDIEVEFADAIDDAAQEPIESAMRSWLDCGIIGGFRDAAQPIDRSMLLPGDDPDLTFDSDLLILRVRDEGIHADAYYMLLNLLARIAASHPIDELTIL